MQKSRLYVFLRYIFENKFEVAIIFLAILFYAIYYLVTPLVRKNLVDNGFVKMNVHYTMVFISLIFLLSVFHNVTDIIKEKMRIRIAAKIEKKLYSQIIYALFEVEQSFYKQKNPVEIITNIQFDINNILRICDKNVFFTFTQLLMFIGGAIGLFVIDSKMACIVVLAIPIKYFIINRLGRKRKELSKYLLKSTNMFNHLLGDIISGIREIKLFNLQGGKKADVDSYLDSMIHDKSKANMLDSINDVSDDFVVSLIENVIYFCGALLIFYNGLTLGSLFAFITYAYQVIDPISAVINIKYTFQGIVPSFDRYYDLLIYCRENQECVGKKHIDRIKSINFKNVSIEHGGNTLVDDASFSINKGEKIMLVGENGSGKSTLLRILLKLEKITSGSIAINGISIEDIKVAEYRDRVFTFFQDSYIFDMNFVQNVYLYGMGQNSNIKAIVSACNCDKVYEKYKNKNVGINGEFLSSGERQKLLFARSLAYDKDLYIYDEPTSNLDKYSQGILHSIINSWLKDKTVIIVAHSDDMIHTVDKILYITAQKQIVTFYSPEEYFLYMKRIR